MAVMHSWEVFACEVTNGLDEAFQHAADAIATALQSKRYASYSGGSSGIRADGNVHSRLSEHAPELDISGTAVLLVGLAHDEHVAAELSDQLEQQHLKLGLHTPERLRDVGLVSPEWSPVAPFVQIAQVLNAYVGASRSCNTDCVADDFTF